MLPTSEVTAPVLEPATEPESTPPAAYVFVSAPLVATISTTPASTTITLTEMSSLVASPPSGGDLEEEFIAELIDSFYNSLRWCLYLVFKGVKTPFKSLKSMLVYAIESIKAVGGPQRVKSVEQLVENFEKDMNGVA